MAPDDVIEKVDESRSGVIDQATLEAEAYAEQQESRRQLWPRVVAVGLLAGLMAVSFRWALTLADFLRHQLIDLLSGFSDAFKIPMLAAVGATLSVTAVFLVRRFSPEAAGSGIPHLEAVLRGYRSMDWKRILPIKFLSGVFAMGSGMVLGREGPSVQMGGAIGRAVANSTGIDNADMTDTLTSAGAGAGLAAAFNAPLAGLIFVLEELQRDFRPLVFGAAFLAAAIADTVARVATGQVPNFHAPVFETPDLLFLPAFAGIGVICGLFGPLFNRSLLASLDLVREWKPVTRYGFAALIGGLATVLSAYSALSIGSGHAVVEMALAGKIALGAIPLLLVGRFILTIASYTTGSAGGIFAPLLALGALLGAAGGWGAHLLVPDREIAIGAFAAVGMAAAFTGIVRAPLTGIVLVVEMTSSYTLMLPLLVAGFMAFIVGELVHEMPIYESLLQKDLARSGHQLEHGEEAIIVNIEVREGASFVGKAVRDLGLPRGVVLTRARWQSKEIVPRAETIIEAHMRLRAVISPEAVNGLKALSEGCEPENP
ncbi:MAG: H(+)/Cl(-) exchange transporter ClcA [Fimbriimonadaceae bacterium]|nr:H(+)/Cl(-) exchange transporter ClcA [Fimbriimonadaceae bacterium]